MKCFLTDSILAESYVVALVIASWQMAVWNQRRKLLQGL